MVWRDTDFDQLTMDKSLYEITRILSNNSSVQEFKSRNKLDEEADTAAGTAYDAAGTAYDASEMDDL